MAFFGVLLIGAYAVGSNHSVDGPTTTTAVTSTAVKPVAGVVTAKQIVRNGRGARKGTTTTTTTTTSPGTPARTVTTTVSGGRSFFERVTGDDGGVLLRIGAVLLAALIAGAAIQRVLVGQYGGFKVGTFEIEDLADASGETLKKLKDALAQAQQESSTKLGQAEDAINALRGELATTKAAGLERETELNRTLAVITARLATIGERPEGTRQ